MKTCTKCEVEKPFESFYKNKKSRDGYGKVCKECEKLRVQEAKANPISQMERQLRSSILLENKLLYREGKKICQRCKNIFLIEDLIYSKRCEDCQKEYKQDYRERSKEKEKVWRKNYIEKNKDKIKKYNKDRNKKDWAENKDKIKEKIKKHYEDNPDKLKEKKREQQKRKRERLKQLNKNMLDDNKIDKGDIMALMDELERMQNESM